MFSIPVTVPVRFDDAVHGMDVTIDIDKIVVVNPIDIEGNFDVECNELYDFRPLSELVLIDGRKLPVCEPPAIIHRYLDAYRQIEDFYTQPIQPIEPRRSPASQPGDRGNVISLFFGSQPPCDISEGSTPA